MTDITPCDDLPERFRAICRGEDPAVNREQTNAYRADGFRGQIPPQPEIDEEGVFPERMTPNWPVPVPETIYSDMRDIDADKPHRKGIGIFHGASFQTIEFNYGKKDDRDVWIGIDKGGVQWRLTCEPCGWQLDSDLLAAPAAFVNLSDSLFMLVGVSMAKGSGWNPLLFNLLP